jgi:hypothetical protein
VKEELRDRKISLAHVKGWPIPIRLKLVSHEDKREFQALVKFMELASRELGRQGVWDPAPESGQ